MICEFCNENQTKYKCPRCFVKYCSLACYKTHKESCAQKENVHEAQTEHSSKPTITSDDRNSRISFSQGETDESEDRVSQEALAKLEHSDELRRMLQNPHLQKMLQHLDSSERAETDMEAAMKEPIFTEFVDQCLYIVEPPPSE